MSAGKVVALGTVVAVAFFAGVGRGHNGSPEPKVVTEVKVVTIPSYPDTRVEIKEVPVVKPLPVSCTEAYKMFQQDQPDYDVIASGSSELKTLLSDSGVLIGGDDITGQNKVAEKLIILKRKLDPALNTRTLSEINFERRLEQCNKEMPK